MISSSLGGRSGFKRSGEAGVRFRMESKMTAEVSPRKGSEPVHISYRTAPKENKSVRASRGFPRACSGRHVSHGAECGARAGQVLFGGAGGRELRGSAIGGSRFSAFEFRQTKIQNLGVSAIGDENVGRLDVTVDDALRVRGIKRVGDLHAQVQNFFQIERLAADQMF